MDAEVADRPMPEVGTIDYSDASAGALVIGRVLDANTQRPLSGRTVAIGNRGAMTDAAGTFQLRAPDGSYDAVVLEGDRSSISIYRGLTRRDPVLSHRRSVTSRADEHTGGVSGNLSGGPSWPLSADDFAAVYLFSEQAESHTFLAGGQPPYGPAFGPMSVSWNGPEAIAADLFAYVMLAERSVDGGAAPAFSAWYARQSVSLTAGVTVRAGLAVARVPLGHLGGSVDVPMGSTLTQLDHYYRLPIPGAVVLLGNEEIRNPVITSFDYLVPDLTAENATLCVAAISTAAADLWAERCGLTLGTDGAKLALRSAPLLQTPKAGPVASDTVFSWTMFDGGIHMLALQPDSPFAGAPSIDLYTSETNVVWPDLAPVGVRFPRSVSYKCSINGWAPFVTMDDAVGAHGLGMTVHEERWRSESVPIDLVTQ
jgi:hypothetical protein